MAEDRPAMKDPLRFGVFEIDPSSRELRKHGVRIKLQDQPFAVLLILLEKPGEIVTREELQQRLWPADTFVEFDKGIYNALKRLREALGDSAENPRYVETLPRRGYRFIAPITNTCPITSVDVQSEAAPLNLGQTRSRRITLLASLIAFLVAVSGVAVWRWMARHPGAPRVLGFRQLTHDGQAKEGPLATDGPRVYFNEILPGPHSVVAQVSVHGGESAPLPIQLSQPTVADVSEDGTDLLLENHEEDGESLWIQPVLSGSPRRVGTVLAHDAAFGPGATNVVYGRGNDVYSINGDGGGLRKLLNAGHVAFAFRYSPDRRLLRFTIFDVQIDDMSIIESAAEASAPRKILRGCWGKWTPDGHHFVFQKRHHGRLDFWTLPEMRTIPWAHVDQPQQLTDGPLDYQYPLPSKDGKTILHWVQLVGRNLSATTGGRDNSFLFWRESRPKEWLSPVMASGSRTPRFPKGIYGGAKLMEPRSVS